MTSLAISRRPIAPTGLAQHAQNCVALRETRSVLMRSAHMTLEQLARLDERLRASLDALRAAGEEGARLADEARVKPGVGAAFTVAVLALQNRDEKRLARLIALARVVPEARRGLVSALGWVSAASLRQVAAGWFATPDKFLRRLGIAACTVHRVDPGPLLAAAIESDDPGLRAVAAGCAGELGRLDMRAGCLALLDDDDPLVRLQAARSAVLLGDRAQALDVCGAIALGGGRLRGEALPLAVLASDRKQARALAERLASQRDKKQPATTRLLLYALALAGDLRFVDWLISSMSDPLHGRLAGEAFALITGADLVLLDLEQTSRANVAAAASFDDDKGMPWPDPSSVGAWWRTNKAGFTVGARHFIGTAPDAAHCQHILRESRQRRRWVAALHLVVATPGSVLFNAAAPGWRQQRLLNDGSRHGLAENVA